MLGLPMKQINLVLDDFKVIHHSFKSNNYKRVNKME